MLTGLSFTQNQWQSLGEGGFNAINAHTHETLEPTFANASLQQLDDACELAYEAFKQYRKTSRSDRALFLNTIADELLKREEVIVARAPLETGLPEARIRGELGRTVGQLRMFANKLLNEPVFIAKDDALPERQPLPRPELTMQQLPIGPVAVFGASNFPLAFSAAGGDTASALAAGCSVVYKSHSAHPGTSEIVTTAIAAAIKLCDMPNGVYQMLHAKPYDISHALVKHGRIQAVGFTGSYQVGMALQDSIKQRKQMIPFYGELGSTNPQLLLPGFVNGKEQEVADTFAASLSMGAGQFCTNPGVWFVARNDAAAFIAALQVAIEKVVAQPMLTPAILKTYQAGCQLFAEHAEVVAKGHHGDLKAQTLLFSTNVQDYLTTPQLHQELFGPAALMVTYDSLSELEAVFENLEGQLTASVHGTDFSSAEVDSLIELLSYKVGRLIYNQMPTGVEVSSAMMHGGPFPSSSDVRSTSVGEKAIERFLRPLCVQNK